MNTKTLDGKEYTLTEGEGGKLTLTPLIKQPEPRTPEAGDVLGWDSNSGRIGIYSERDGIPTVTETDGDHWVLSKIPYQRFNNLGKFSEVYVKVADVRDALIFRDQDGENALDWFSDRDNSDFSGGLDYGRAKSCNALRKLGIIQD